MSESADVAITTVLSILVIVDIVGNSAVCLIITKNRDMRYAETKIRNISRILLVYGRTSTEWRHFLVYPKFPRTFRNIII